MDEKEEFRKSDYVTDVISKFNASFLRLDEQLTTPSIREKAKTFEKNIEKTILLAHLPEFVARESRILTQIQDTAVQIINAPAHLSYDSREYLAYVNERLPDALLYVQREFDKTSTPATRKAQFEAAENTLLFIFDPDSGHPSLKALQALYISLILNTWTAFESMAGDLWETALNLHPKILADLACAENRIGARLASAGSESDRAEGKAATSKEIPLAQIHDITLGSYDLAHKMGTLLKRKFRFTSLKETRHAYSRAFSKNFGAIDDALSDESLDMLYAIRNVFAHKAGVVDREYDGRRKAYPLLPQVDSGQQIELDGKTVRERINTVITCGVKLLIAVDDWILTNP